MPEWLKEGAPESDVVVSTRIRLARNMMDMPFPPRIRTREQIEAVHAGAADSVLKCPEFRYTRLSDLSEVQKRSLLEKNIISSDLMKSPDGAIIMNEDESVSLMILEEDHYRIQAIKSGLALSAAYYEAETIDNMLSKGVRYAYDGTLGFLTSCPTNVGTGLRASLMLHLPALTAAKGIQRISAMVGKVGMTVRGAFGEGSAAAGSFYQISNQVTLGVTEKEIITRLRTTAGKVMDFERNTRKELYKNLGVSLEDRIWRSVGILRNARKVSDAEAQKLISDVAFGASLNIVRGLSVGTLYRVMMDIRPAVIAEKYGINQPNQRDVFRANILRDTFREVYDL